MPAQTMTPDVEPEYWGGRTYWGGRSYWGGR
jgi:hypothetical protein